MPASEAQIQANRQNALRSTGPKTAEGKENSRRNGLKHGLTGDGVVLKPDDSTEVARRTAELLDELAPQSALGTLMVRQMATLSVRMERSQDQDQFTTSKRVRHAAENFDEEQIDRAEALFGQLGESPRTSLRRLRSFPEGIDRLIDAWHELRGQLTRETKPDWTLDHQNRMENLTGLKAAEATGLDIDRLSQATRGDLSQLSPFEVHQAGKVGEAWARTQLVERVDLEVAKLEQHYQTLDHRKFELDRAEAKHRVYFDPSREATLARRYEAEATRAFYKALKEFRLAESEQAQQPPAPQPAPTPEEPDPLASSRYRPNATPREPQLTSRQPRPSSDTSYLDDLKTLMALIDSPLP